MADAAPSREPGLRAPPSGAGFALCPRCYRAVPAAVGERYCLNDGAPLLAACPRCRTAITSPYARYCTACGTEFKEKE